jgi:hypothetical protein
MAVELTRRGLLDHRRALAGWCLGVIGYAALVSSIFPSIKGSADFEKLVEHYPDALKSLFGLTQGGGITSGAGFIDAELFSLILPLFVLVLAIGSGARVFAGEEEAGRLELVLSYPVRRRDALLAKAAAVAGEVALVCPVGFAALLVLSEAVGLDLDRSRLAAALAGVAALGLLYGWLALAVGAAVPARCSLPASPPGTPPPPTWSVDSTASPAGSILCASSRRSGSWVRPRCKTGSEAGACSLSSPRRSSRSLSARCWSTGATSSRPERGSLSSGRWSRVRQ